MDVECLAMSGIKFTRYLKIENIYHQPIIHVMLVQLQA